MRIEGQNKEMMIKDFLLNPNEYGRGLGLINYTVVLNSKKYSACS